MVELKHLSNKELVDELIGIVWFYSHERQQRQKGVKKEILRRLEINS